MRLRHRAVDAGNFYPLQKSKSKRFVEVLLDLIWPEVSENSPESPVLSSPKSAKVAFHGLVQQSYPLQKKKTPKKKENSFTASELQYFDSNIKKNEGNT